MDQQEWQKKLEKMLFGREIEGETPEDRLKSIREDPAAWKQFRETSQNEWNAFSARVKDALDTKKHPDVQQRLLKDNGFWLRGLKAFLAVISRNFYVSVLVAVCLLIAMFLKVNLGVLLVVPACLLILVICLRAYPKGLVRTVCVCLAAIVLLSSLFGLATPKEVRLRSYAELTGTPTDGGTTVRTKTNGGGTTPCVACRGSKQCRECRGVGTVTCGSPYGGCLGKRHIACGGLGCNACNNLGMCPYCKGTLKRDCPACDGGVCSVCDGYGYY